MPFFPCCVEYHGDGGAKAGVVRGPWDQGDDRTDYVTIRLVPGALCTCTFCSF